MDLKSFRYCGFRRIAAACPRLKVGDIEFNLSQIKQIIKDLHKKSISVALFPELSITGYTCADLFLQPFLHQKAEEAVEELANFISRETPEMLCVVGAPVNVNGKLYNCAVAIGGTEIAAVVPKSHIPNYGEFYERRWFEPGAGIDYIPIHYANETRVPFGTGILIRHCGMTIGIEICEDLWTPIPPSSFLAIAGADVILNLSASNAVLGKQRYRRELILQQSARCRCAYLYASSGFGESSTDLAFPGYAAAAENGSMLAEATSFPDNTLISDNPATHIAIADIDPEFLQAERIKFNTFASLPLKDQQESPTIVNTGWKNPPSGEGKLTPINGRLNPMPFVPSDPDHRNENCTEIINIQCHGLLQRLQAIGFPKMIIGVSGGLDSTLALLVAVRTANMAGMKPSDVIGITMPGLATTNRTHNNAWRLMEQLGCTSLEIPIGEAVAQHFKDINQNPNLFDATYENSQARERTQILMDYANKIGGIVIGTGDLSELALGWCTYNGDHISMYAVNTSVPKTLVKYLVEWFALKEKNEETKRILFDIIDTPISPELVPAKEGRDEIEQKTEDLVGPYELHDFFLFHLLRNSFSPRKIYLLALEAFKDKYDAETILRWIRTFYRRFFSQQFKRSCLPDGPKVGSVCLSPRGDWRMPSDASASLWLKELDDPDFINSIEEDPYDGIKELPF